VIDEKMRMQYSLGGLLYLPSANKNIIQKIKDRAFSHLTSLAFCLEDAIQDDFLDEAEKNLGDILAELVELAEFEKGGDKDSLPLIFIRIRCIVFYSVYKSIKNVCQCGWKS